MHYKARRRAYLSLQGIFQPIIISYFTLQKEDLLIMEHTNYLIEKSINKKKLLFRTDRSCLQTSENFHRD